jgi:hypothetical protein
LVSDSAFNTKLKPDRLAPCAGRDGVMSMRRLQTVKSAAESPVSRRGFFRKARI